MSTFLVTLTVVVLSIVGAVAIAVQDPAQPATARAGRRRVTGPAPVRPAKHPAQRPAKRRTGPRPGPKPVAAMSRRRPRTLQPVQPARQPVPQVQQLSAATRPMPLPAGATGTAEVAGLTEQWATGPVGQSFWARLRSGVVLTMLLALVGALVAAGVAGVIVALAVAVRSAVG